MSSATDHPSLKQVNLMDQMILKPDIETDNPHIPAESTAREQTFQAYRQCCRDVFERQHGVDVASVLATSGAEIVNRDAHAFAFRVEPLDLTPSG